MQVAVSNLRGSAGWSHRYDVQGQLGSLKFSPHWTDVLQLRTQTQKVVALKSKIFGGGGGGNGGRNKFYHITLDLLLDIEH